MRESVCRMRRVMPLVLSLVVVWGSDAPCFSRMPGLHGVGHRSMDGLRFLTRDLFEVGANYLNYILRCFLGGFRILRHVVDDVIFHEFAHQAVNGTAGSSEAPENFGALLVVVQSLKNRLELTDDFLGSIHQVQLFSRGVRHFA